MLYNLLSAWSGIGWIILLSKAFSENVPNSSSGSTPRKSRKKSSTNLKREKKKKDRPPYHSLTTLDGIGSTRAKKLYEEGYESPVDLRKVDKSELKQIEGIGDKTAQEIVDSFNETKQQNYQSKNRRVKNQCEKLDINFKEIEMNYANKRWYFDGEGFGDPEFAEGKRLRRSGYKVGLKERWPFDVLLKTTCLNLLIENDFDPYSACSTYFGPPRISGIKKKILNSSRKTVVSNYRKLRDYLGTRKLYLGEISEEFIVDLFESLTNEQISFIANKHYEDRVKYKKGWPDLTRVKDGEVDLIEVKTTDSLSKSQKTIIKDIAKPADLNYKVHRLKAKI